MNAKATGTKPRTIIRAQRILYIWVAYIIWKPGYCPIRIGCWHHNRKYISEGTRNRPQISNYWRGGGSSGDCYHRIIQVYVKVNPSLGKSLIPVKWLINFLVLPVISRIILMYIITSLGAKGINKKWVQNFKTLKKKKEKKKIKKKINSEGSKSFRYKE